MRKITLARASFTVAALSLALAIFWLGVRQGAMLALYTESIYGAGISLGMLNSANNGQVTRNMLTTLEADIDSGLLHAYALQQHPLRKLAEPVWGIPASGVEPVLERLATYRKTHPSPLSAVALSSEPLGGAPNAAQSRAELLAGVRANDQIIQLMVSQYSR